MGIKGLSSLLWIVVALAVILLAGSQLIGIANLANIFRIPASISTYEGCGLIKPTFGRMACEPLQEPFTAYRIDYDKYMLTVKCGDLENSPACELWVRIPSMEWGAGKIKLAKDCPLYKGILPDQCTVWLKYRINDGEWRSKQLIWGPNDPNLDTWFKILDKTEYPLGTKVDIEFWYGLVGTYGLGRAKGDIKETYTPYGLNVYEDGGKWRYNTQSCYIGDVHWEDRNKVCLSGDCPYTLEKTGQGYNVRETQTLGFNDWVNYLSGWTSAPIDPNIGYKIVNYNGQDAYCQVNAVYSLKRFETLDGSCWYYPANLIAYVDCCPGMTSANSVCGDDFKWHPLAVGECSSDQDCISKYGSDYYCQDGQCVRKQECFSALQCYGMGDWYVDYSKSEPTICRQDCIDGQCRIVECKQTECVPPNIGCPANMVCDPVTYKCVLQQGPQIVCGDGVCSQPYETWENCPQDCKQPPGMLDSLIKFLWYWLIAFILTLVGLVILAFIPVPFISAWVRRLVKNWRMLLLIAAGIALVLVVFFTVPIAQIASVVRGV